MVQVESFSIDHTKMVTPGVRLAKRIETTKGERITVFDLRFCKPNVEIMDDKGMHTLEHLLAGAMRSHLDKDGVKIIDISPMGCRTGFYMSVIGEPSSEEVGRSLEASLRDVLEVKSLAEVPGANEVQCGSANLHSLEEAHRIAQKALERGFGVIDSDAIALKGV
ncbi:MAG: S-ribosylhomocysteine lyase [Campylobacterales bacterium]